MKSINQFRFFLSIISKPFGVQRCEFKLCNVVLALSHTFDAFSFKLAQKLQALCVWFSVDDCCSFNFPFDLLLMCHCWFITLQITIDATRMMSKNDSQLMSLVCVCPCWYHHLHKRQNNGEKISHFERRSFCVFISCVRFYHICWHCRPIWLMKRMKNDMWCRVAWSFVLWYFRLPQQQATA